MGDHRCDVKITLTFDKEYKFNAWLNYWPTSDRWDIDQRVVDFLEKSWRDYYDRYQEQRRDEQAEQYAEDIRNAELLQLKKLREKYPDTA